MSDVSLRLPFSITTHTAQHGNNTYRKCICRAQLLHSLVFKNGMLAEAVSLSP